MPFNAAVGEHAIERDNCPMPLVLAFAGIDTEIALDAKVMAAAPSRIGGQVMRVERDERAR